MARRFAVDGREVTIGRGSQTTVRIGDPEVSRRHCVIDEINGVLLVRDLGSTNGTFVNGEMIYEAVVKPGDRLTIGRSRFVVHYEPNLAK
jgi:pSer/pThr/pTyr-binding forkhead associated (FHA) protein